jgi:hypothetical protein
VRLPAYSSKATESIYCRSIRRSTPETAIEAGTRAVFEEFEARHPKPELPTRRDWFFVALMWLSDLGLIVAGLIVLWDPDPMAAVGAIEMITKNNTPTEDPLFRRSLILQPNHLADLVPLPGSGHRPHQPVGAEHLELFARFPRDGWDSVGHQEGIQARR